MNERDQISQANTEEVKAMMVIVYMDNGKQLKREREQNFQWSC